MDDKIIHNIFIAKCSTNEEKRVKAGEKVIEELKKYYLKKTLRNIFFRNRAQALSILKAITMSKNYPERVREKAGRTLVNIFLKDKDFNNLMGLCSSPKLPEAVKKEINQIADNEVIK